ncbi:MAG: FAD-binding dehydrogenase [Chitinophagales bacterium]|nr:FAD-binding dehydrogenase [Chitinophagales bacterium]
MAKTLNYEYCDSQIPILLSIFILYQITMPDKSYKTEVAIAGGGIAGIITAFELLNYGKKVTIVERDAQENFGGLAKESFGGMFFVDTPYQRRNGIKDSVDLALRDWFSVAEFEEEDVWQKKHAENYVTRCTEDVFWWLRKHGISYFPVVHWVERGMFKPGNSVPRFHMVWGTGYGLATTMMQHLLNHAKKGNLEILFRHKVTDISFTNKKASGLVGVNEETNEPFRIDSDVVVVAAGGMGGNIERVKKQWYKPWGKPPEIILNGSHKYAQGDLHDVAEKYNANVTHLEWSWPYAAGVHHPRPKRENHGLSLVPCKSALWMNYKGERIGPIPLVTAYDTRFCVEQICKQEKKYSWQVLNLKIAYKEFAVSGSESNEAIRNKNWLQFLSVILWGNRKLVHDMLDNCVDFVTATSIEELAEKMNALQGTKDVDVNLLRDGIKTYDAHIERGPAFHDDEQLRRIAHARQYRGDRVRTCKFQKIDDKNAYPLIAIREFILSRKTIGGIQTDLEGKVLTKPVNGKQEPIDGLYAVGECAGFGGGGMHGIGSLEGTFLGGCVLTGRMTAKSIAGEKV